MDLIFVVDSSGSIRQHRFEMVISYIKQVVDALEVADDRVRVGLITYGDSALVRFNLNSYKFKEDVLQAIETTEYSRGKTATADALKQMRQAMFTARNGDRLDVPNFAVVVTDGQSNVRREDTIPEAIQARIEGVHIMAVTVMPDGPNLEIKGIASDPDDYNLFNVQNFNDLGSLVSRLVDGVCNGKWRVALGQSELAICLTARRIRDIGASL